jgi:adenylate cyclase
MSFIAELRRRNVIRMAGLYLVGAWLVTQVAGTILPMFDAPDWVARTVVVLLAIGFIPALIISWVFELTPDGLRREDDAAPVEPMDSSESKIAQRMNRMFMVVMALALSYFAFDKFVLAPSRDNAREQAAQVSAAPASASPVTASDDEGDEMKLLAELKRCDVTRRAALYLLGAWMIVQVDDSPVLGLIFRCA